MAGVYAYGLTPDQIDDLVENTLHHFEKDAWVDLSSELQRYFAYSNFLLGDKTAIAGGDQLQWQVKVRNTGAARNSGMYAVDDVSVADVTKHAIIPWAKVTTGMAYDVDEPEFQSGDAVRILGLLKVRRHDALTSLAELMEINFWSTPLNLTDDGETKKPRGVPYWIVRNATKGFNGGVPINTTGISDVAGLNPTTYPRWKNFTGQYAAISRRDLVRLLREAVVKCNFRAPVAHPKVGGGSESPRYVMATTYEVISRLEELVEEQNQNLGNDVASKDGDLIFRRVPIQWVPFLDANHDATAGVATNQYGKNPVYGLDKNCFRMVFKQGRYMVRSEPITAPNQHTVRQIFWDSWLQFQCFDRRPNFVVTQSA